MMATLHGRCVESSTLSPIPGVNVNAGSGASITDGNGEFTINVYPGTIRLVASAYGYAGYSQMLSIPGEGSFEVGTIPLRATRVSAL